MEKANVIYVGNYPTFFTDNDIIDIFSDFDDLVLLRSVKKNQKCYAFMLCTNEDQVFDVVLTLNKTEVGGRELIVRSSDDDIQSIIDTVDDEDYVEEEEEFIPNPRSNYIEKVSNGCDNLSYDTGSYRQPRNPSRLILKNDSPSSKGAQSLSSRNVQLHGLKHGNFPGNKDFDTASCSSYATTNRGGRHSPGSTISRLSKTDRRGERFSFVSVLNFRNGTTAEELEQLFADYEPYKVIMRRSKSYSEEDPTEAIVCFFKSRNAANSILNLDNTIYKGRLLLVMECNDFTLMSELIQVHNLK